MQPILHATPQTPQPETTYRAERAIFDARLARHRRRRWLLRRLRLARALARAAKTLRGSDRLPGSADALCTATSEHAGRRTLPVGPAQRIK